jgi:hypothetical protein
VQAVAGGQHDQVVLVALAVDEPHAVAVEPVDVGPHGHVAVADVVEHQRVHDRVRLVDPVVRLREPEAHRVAGERLEDARVHRLLDPRR